MQSHILCRQSAPPRIRATRLEPVHVTQLHALEPVLGLVHSLCIHHHRHADLLCAVCIPAPHGIACTLPIESVRQRGSQHLWS